MGRMRKGCLVAMALMVTVILAEPLPEAPGIEGCLQKDSISCVQIQIFRNMRSFFGQDSVDLVGGLALVKNPLPAEESSRALNDETSSETQILAAKDPGQREDILEAFTLSKMSRFFQERSLTWNLSPVVNEVAATARGVMDKIPASIKEKISTFMNEGRGKKKKLLKSLLPLLIAIKLKIKAFLILAFLAVAAIAGLSLLISLAALALSGFIALKKLLSKHHMPHHHEPIQVHAEYVHSGGYPSVGGGGYSSGGGGGGWESYGHGDSHGSYSNNVAHTLAYNGQKPVRR